MYPDCHPSGIASRNEVIDTLLTCYVIAMDSSTPPDEVKSVVAVANEILKRAWNSGILPKGRIPFPALRAKPVPPTPQGENIIPFRPRASANKSFRWQEDIWGHPTLVSAETIHLAI
jgi:hypothetical protein